MPQNVVRLEPEAKKWVYSQAVLSSRIEPFRCNQCLKSPTSRQHSRWQAALRGILVRVRDMGIQIVDP